MLLRRYFPLRFLRALKKQEYKGKILKGKMPQTRLSTIDYEKYAFILAGKNRTRTVLALIIENTPSRLARLTQKHLSHTSRALKELTRKGIIQCMTGNLKTGRLYKLTPIGKELRKRLVRLKIQW